MRRHEFSILLDELFDEIRSLNATKGHDYAGDEDALANFKSEAEYVGIRPEQVWHVYAHKHWSAIGTFVREGDVKSEPIEGRLLDLALYLFLFVGLVREAPAVDELLDAHGVRRELENRPRA